MEFLSIKKNVIVTFVGKWMELEVIMLTEIGQTWKDKYHTFSLIYKKYIWKPWK